MQKSQKGFTIIELVVVIAIIAVLSGIVIVNVNTSINKAKVVRANTEAKNIENAFTMFYAKYGDYPMADGGIEGAWAYYSAWNDPLSMYLNVGGTPRYITEFLKIDWTGYNASYFVPYGFYYMYFYDSDGDGKIGCGYMYLTDGNYDYGFKYIFTQDCPDYSQYNRPFTTDPEVYGWWI